MNRLLDNKFFVIFLSPFLLGGVLVFSFPPYNLTIINFFSFSTLLLLIFFVKKRTESKYIKKISKRYFFYIGSAFGFGFFLFGNYWIAISLTHDEMFSNLIPFALILIPLFLSFFFGLAVLIVSPFVEKSIFFILFFSLTFSIFEFLRGIVLTGFPWNLIAYSWSWSLESLQILSIIGTYSFSLISLIFFCSPFLFLKRKDIKKNIVFILILLILFIGNYVYGLNKINNSNYSFDKNISIKVVSPSFTLNDYKSNGDIFQLEQLIKISDPQKEKKTIFIWPEGILYESYLQNISQYKALFSNKFSDNHLIVLGASDSRNDKYFNSLAIFNNKLEIISQYDKINLVPFGEFLPFEKTLSKLGLKKITQGYNSFSPGNDRPIINLNNKFNKKTILPLICYEIIYPGKIKKKNQFPDIVINISEDAWFGKSIGPYQHFSKAIYRSIEEGVFIARSANKGISAFINPNGKVIKSLNMGERGNIELNFPYFAQPTVFSKYGNKIFFLIILLCIFLILILGKSKTYE